MDNFTTMIVVLGGTLLFAAVLLYLSLPSGSRVSNSKRRDAAQTAALMAATSDRVRAD